MGLDDEQRKVIKGEVWFSLILMGVFFLFAGFVLLLVGHALLK